MPSLLEAIPELPAVLCELLRQVPAGRVTTFGDLAQALGDIRAARWIGEALRKRENLTNCPWHRVVRGTGELSDSADDEAGAAALRLIGEGVPVHNWRVDLARFRFAEFVSDHPLRRLIELQKMIRGKLDLRPLKDMPNYVAGVDTSYAAPDRAVAAYALVEVATGQLVWSATAVKEVTFPYIPGYLAFRELPVLMDVLHEVRRARGLAEIILVDGNGILHPRRAGIATCVGIELGVTTIGVGKSLLCGTVQTDQTNANGSHPVVHHGEAIALTLRAKPRAKPVFVSPGQGIDLAGAWQVARSLLHGHRLPEPLFQADAISRAVAQTLKKQL